MEFAKTPEELHAEWEEIVDTLSTALAAAGTIQVAPAWALGMSISEYNDEIRELKEELDLAFTLTMLASIEAVFMQNVSYAVLERPREPWARTLRTKYRRQVGRKIEIRIDDLLDTWKTISAPASPRISQLKAMFNYRHWLAHGRYWRIQYWTIPKPNEVLLLYNGLTQSLSML